MLFNSKVREEAPVPEAAPELLPDKAPQLKLSQSLLKAIEEETMCPQFYKEYHWLSQHPVVPTQAQRIGQYFEWLALNNRPRGGEVITPAQTGRGKQTVDQTRIEQQAKVVVTTLERYDMHVVNPQGQDYPSTTLSMVLDDYPDIVFEGTMDAITKSLNEPGVYTIVDLKATKTLYSRFGPNGKPGWGDFYNMDHVQPYSYLWLARTLLPKQTWRFRYAVFSYDAGKHYEIFEVDMGSLELQELKQRVNLGAARLMEWAETNFEPIGHPNCCTRCIHRLSCPAARLVKPIIHFKKSF